VLGIAKCPSLLHSIAAQCHVQVFELLELHSLDIVHAAQHAQDLAAFGKHPASADELLYDLFPAKVLLFLHVCRRGVSGCVQSTVLHCMQNTFLAHAPTIQNDMHVRSWFMPYNACASFLLPEVTDVLENFH